MMNPRVHPFPVEEDGSTDFGLTVNGAPALRRRKVFAP